MGIKKSDSFEDLQIFVDKTLGKLRTTGKGSRTRLGSKLVDLGERILEKFPPEVRK